MNICRHAFDHGILHLVLCGATLWLSVTAVEAQSDWRVCYERECAQAAIHSGYIGAVANAHHRLAESQLVKAQAESERMRGLRLRIEAANAATDLGQKRFQIYQQRRQLRHAQRQLAEQRSQQQLLNSFFNGRITAENSRAFVKCMKQVRCSDAMNQFLGQKISRIEEHDFQSRCTIFAVLKSDGSLRRPPAALFTRQPDHPIAIAGRDVHEAWQACWQRLRYGEALAADELLRLNERVNVWETSAKTRPLLTSAAARSTASSYLRTLRQVVAALESTKGRQRIGYLAEQGSLDFPGGSLGQLLEYICVWKLEIRAGSEAATQLGRLGNQLCQLTEESLDEAAGSKWLDVTLVSHQAVSPRDGS